MSATVSQPPPVVPPRPSRSHEMAKVPPRPVNRHIERSVSPNPDRFAPSPLNESPFCPKSPRSSRFAPSNGQMHTSDPIDRSRSVELPSVGEEGREYAALAEAAAADSSHERDSSPEHTEHTRSVGNDLKLHAPKPSLPAVSAKQRVAMVTRTDSDKAASFGIGRPSVDDVQPSNRSLKKKASTTSQLSASERDFEDEHGIPEIGQQVPLFPNAGDVQAHTPVPSANPTDAPKKNHKRKGSARGHLPGSYGLHGHGLLPLDKLEKAYYEKHPEAAAKEHNPYGYDRPQDFSRSKEELNRLVRDTASRGTGHGSGTGTPSEQVGWQAIEQSTSRLNSPHPESGNPEYLVTSPLQKVISPEISVSDVDAKTPKPENTIHVEDPANRRRSVMFSDDEGNGSDNGSEHHYTAPILAADEVAKHPPAHHQPAVEPFVERRGSHDEESHSRPTSRPTSIYREQSFEHRSTPLEDVEEYEPLFPEEDKKPQQQAAAPPPVARRTSDYKHRFPSRDIWEDAPNSVHYTAEVSTPDILEGKAAAAAALAIPTREGETPAQAFARHQEELAEKESRDTDSFLWRTQKASKTPPREPDSTGLWQTQKPANWVQNKAHLQAETKPQRPGTRRFPSQDIWEDTPDSLRLETTVSAPQQEEASSPADASPKVPQRPARKPTDPSSVSSDKPAVPERPKPKQLSPDTETSKPVIPERPKPQVPARPTKQGSGSSEKDTEAAPARAKPAVPARPVGGKIAALQAGFMSDLNKRLQLGPQAPKKEEPAAEEAAEEQEKAPLADVRKGRARGPQRRAPRASPSPAAAASSDETPAKAPAKFSFSMTTTVFSIDPEAGAVATAPVGALLPETAPEKEAAEARSLAVPEDAASESILEEAEETEEPHEAKIGTLATNTAGETILETKVEADKEAVKPIAAEEVAKE